MIFIFELIGTIAFAISGAVIVILRHLAAHYRWSLPKIE